MVRSRRDGVCGVAFAGRHLPLTSRLDGQCGRWRMWVSTECSTAQVPRRRRYRTTRSPGHLMWGARKSQIGGIAIAIYKYTICYPGALSKSGSDMPCTMSLYRYTTTWEKVKGGKGAKAQGGLATARQKGNNFRTASESTRRTSYYAICNNIFMDARQPAAGFCFYMRKPRRQNC